MTDSSSGSEFRNDSPDPSPGGYCPTCGAPHSAGQGYCGRCGSRLVTEAASVRSPGPPGEAQGVDDTPFGTGATVGAVLLTVVMPVIAVIVALALRSQEHRLKRKQFLKNWAIGSGIWLCTGWLIPLIALSSATSGLAGCKGGIDQFSPPSYQSSDGVHWQATYSCINGGTETKQVPASQVPGG